LEQYLFGDDARVNDTGSKKLFGRELNGAAEGIQYPASCAYPPDPITLCSLALCAERKSGAGDATSMETDAVDAAGADDDLFFVDKVRVAVP